MPLPYRRRICGNYSKMTRKERKVNVELVQAKKPIATNGIAAAIAKKLLKEGIYNDKRTKV